MTLTTISDDGRFLMAGPGSDRLYDRLTGDLTTTLYGRLSGDVRFLATAAGRLEISSGAITPVPASFRSAGEPQPLAISADGVWLAYSVAGQLMARPAELYLWNVADGRVRVITSSIPPLPGSPILLIGGTAFSASGRYVTFTINRADVDCTGGAGCGEVYVYDIVSAELARSSIDSTGNESPCFDQGGGVADDGTVVFRSTCQAPHAPSGRTLRIVGADGSVEVHDIGAPTIGDLHALHLQTVAISRDGGTVVYLGREPGGAASEANHAILLDRSASGGPTYRRLDPMSEYGAVEVVLSSDGAVVAFSSVNEPNPTSQDFREWALWVERLGPSATPAVSPHTPIRLAIAGRHGVPASASAVVFNLTVTRPDQAGFATAWPCGGPRPETSNLNWIGGQDRANLAFVPLDSTGEVCLAVDGRADFVVDVSGYLTGGADFASGGPTRVYDSRSLPGGQRIAAGDVVRVGPFNGPTAMNITAVDALEAGFATAWPCGAAMPDASNNNFPAASASPSMALVTPGDGGHVCIAADKSAHLIVDLFGQFGTSVYTGGIPSRVLDTRAGLAAPPRPSLPTKCSTSTSANPATSSP